MYMLEEYMKTSVSQKALNILRQAIFTGVLRPGDHLLEEEIASDVGVSRTAVRDAIARLETQGLISRSHSGRATIRQLTIQDIKEILFVREVLETAAVDLACKAPEVDRRRSLVQLEAILEKEELELTTDDSKQRRKLNVKFHLGIVRLGGNKFLEETLMSTLDYIQLVLVASPHLPQNVHRSYSEHRRLLQAVYEGDVPQARGLIATHLRHTQENILFALKKSTSERLSRPLRLLALRLQ